jgi:hypothetical protein
MTIKISDKNEMVAFLKMIGTGSQFVSLKTETAVKMRKTNNPFVGAVKVTKRTGLVNVDFIAAVRRRMAELQQVAFSETEYEAGSTWYKHVSTEEGKSLPLCVHQKDERKFYLQFFPLHSRDTKYFLNNRELSLEEINQMKTFITEQERNEFKPIVITLAIDSIREMRAKSITILNKTVNRLAQRMSQMEPAQKTVQMSK